MKHQRPHGFTIVELLIVVVVIAVLAAITIVAYTGIQQRAYTSSMLSDLSTNSKKLELFQVDNAHYPDTVADAAWISANLAGASGTASNGASYSYVPSADLSSYTQSISRNNIIYVNSSSSTTPVDQSIGVATAPGAPTASSITATSFNLSWSALSGVSGYDVTCARNNTLTTTPVTTGSTATPSFSRTGMNAGTSYYCGYTPNYGAVTGTASVVSAVINTPTPAVPTGLNANTIASTSFKINWSNVTGAYRYNLQCTLSTDTAYASPVYTHTGTSLSSGTTGVTINTGITATTSYICRVAAKGYNTTSSYSANITFSTI